jgi:hypothetical protein
METFFSVGFFLVMLSPFLPSDRSNGNGMGSFLIVSSRPVVLQKQFPIKIAPTVASELCEMGLESAKVKEVSNLELSQLEYWTKLHNLRLKNSEL